MPDCATQPLNDELCEEKTFLPDIVSLEQPLATTHSTNLANHIKISNIIIMKIDYNMIKVRFVKELDCERVRGTLEQENIFCPVVTGFELLASTSIEELLVYPESCFTFHMKHFINK